MTDAHDSSSVRLKCRGVLLAAVALFLVFSLDHLSVFPPVGEDEPWIAAAPYKLAVHGVYGSDIFAGYYGAERHNYQHMPLYPFMQAAVFKTIGVGVLEMRLLPVAFGLALLLVVYLVGTTLADPRVGTVGAVLMVLLALDARDDATGILLLDRARVNRYDIAVPVFGLLALWMFFRGHGTKVRQRHFATGVLTGLASLSHLFGGFWLPVFLALSLRRTSPNVPRTHRVGLVLGGFILTWLPWLAYIASGWNDFAGQMRFVAARFDVFNPSFYVTNVLYGGGPIALNWMAKGVLDLRLDRLGAWTTVLAVPLAACALSWNARRDLPLGMRILGIASLAQFLMFLALLKVKTINYMIGLWPLAVLMLAWFAVWLWDSRRTLVRLAVVTLLVVIATEGITRIVQARTAARRTAPYDAYTAAIAACIPEGSLVLGLQHYWLGLRQYEYRTWLLPAIYASSLDLNMQVPLHVALAQIDPDIILIDRYMSRFFADASRADHPQHSMQTGYERFMIARRAKLLCEIPDATYGTMSVYLVPKAAKR